MQDRVDALAPTMSREAYGSGSVNQRSPKPARRDRDIREPPVSSSAKYYGPSSISQPVSSRGSPLGSRTASTENPGRRSSRYGVSRSSNASPLTLPAEGPVPHSISTSAFNVGPSGTHTGGHYYNEDLGSPTMDSRGHHRSRSATRVPLRNYHSLERDQDREFVPIRDPRDRSLDRTDMSGHASRHPRSRERSLDRSGYRERDDYAYRDTVMDGPIDAGDPYRDSGHARSGHGSYSDSRHGYGRSGGGDSSYTIELERRMNDLQCQYSTLKRELDATTQKLGSSMHSIKTFWSPELKKERALRKEEAAKYALLNEQVKTLRTDNTKQAALIRQLEEELRLAHMRNPDAEVQQHLEALYNEKEHMTKEIFLLRETIKELELRIETQKQTLTARDESIKKLMEIKGVGGKIMEEDRLEFEMLKSKLKDTEARYRHLESMLQSRDKDLTKNEKNRIQILEATLETKESRINILEGEIELLEAKLLKNNDKIMNINGTSEETLKSGNDENIDKELSEKMDELRIELNRRDQEIMAMSAKMKTLEEQHHDYQRHIAVLKESLCAKEEHYNMLQADVEELRIRLEEKNKLIEKKTQQTMNSSQERNRLTQEVQELRDHMEIKDRKINVLQRKIENLEDLLKEKDNQVDMARARLTAMQAHHSSSEGALSSLEEAIGDKDKQISQLRDQRDRAEQEKNEERELHEREIAEYKMKMHGMESEMEKLQSDIQRLQQQKRPSIQQDGSQAEIISLRKQIDDKQKKMEEMDKVMKKCQEKLKILESQPPPKAGADSESQKRLVALENLCGELTKEKEKLEKEATKSQEDAKRLQAELDRLLEVMTVTEKEKFSLNEQIRELQESMKEKESKLQGAKRGQQTDRTKNAQMLEEARRRESEAAKEAAKAQEQVQQQQERIEELEEALRESVRITAKREIAVAEKQSFIEAADEKIKSLQSEVRGLQKAHNARCTNCPPMKVKLVRVERQLRKLISERKLHLEQLFEMKQEALSAAISEKDSHLAFLEMSGIKNAKTAEQVDKLKTEKKQLVEKIKTENENRVKLLMDLEDSDINTSNSSIDTKDSPEDSEDDGLRSLS